MERTGILPNRDGSNTRRGIRRNDEAILEQAFTNMLQQMSYCGLNAVSSKFFIVYAHENPSLPEYPAYAQVVQKFIAWFKNLSLDVDSDRSPHGWSQTRGCEISGASNDILKNQMCLMPKEWDSRKVEWVIVFGSPLLGKYMEEEKKWRARDYGNKTYTEAILETCRGIEPSVEQRRETPDWIETVYDQLGDVQRRYSKVMGPSFHHVLTELALLSFRRETQKSQLVIPVVLGADEEECLPKFILETRTLLREYPGTGDLYKTFFKILRRFENLEQHRPLVEEMEDYFKGCKKWLKSSPYATREESLTACSSFLYRAINDILQSPAQRNIDRPITQFEIKNILNSHYYLSAGTITSVSGSSISSDGIVDIELVATLPRSDTKEPEGSRGPEPQRSELVTVGLDDLFSERVLPGDSITKKTVRPKSVLIRGPPGIGKSTLSNRIAYRYSSDYKLKRGKDLVIHLPLRALEHTRNLGELFLKHFFNFDKRNRELARKLEELVLDTRKASTCRVLCILDGLDEARLWDEYEREILLALVERTDRLIITSRFGAAGTAVVGHIDLEFEALGLSMEGVQAYLTSGAVASRMGENTTAIGRYLETHPSMQGMVRVPIHLDMLCYSWGELMHGRTAPPTLTEIYQAISHKLWKKDIPNLSKYDSGEPVNRGIVDTVGNPRRLIRVVLPEVRLLGRLALVLLSEGRVAFTGEDITSAIDALESENSGAMPLSLERNLPKLSFIRRSSPHDHGRMQEYSFIHLSFLEFFAANALVQDPDRLRVTLSRHKYNRRYEVVWRFVTGLFAQNKSKVEGFLHLLDQEPRDLIGINHVHLIMYCLEECSTLSLNHHLRRDVYDRLWGWVEFDTRFFDPELSRRHRGARSNVLASMAFPEDLLRDKLPNDSFRLAGLPGIQWRVLSSDFCLWLIDQVEGAGFPGYLMKVSDMLSAGCQPSLAGEVIQRLVSYWGQAEADHDTKFEFLRQVLKGRDLPRPSAQHLVGFLESANSWSFQVETALDVLLQQPTFCEHTFKFLGLLDPDHPRIKCLIQANTTPDHRYLKCLDTYRTPRLTSYPNLIEVLLLYILQHKKLKIPAQVLSGLVEHHDEFPHRMESVRIRYHLAMELILDQPSIPAEVVTRLKNHLLDGERWCSQDCDSSIMKSEVPELRDVVLPLLASPKLNSGIGSDLDGGGTTLRDFLNFISPGHARDITPKGSKFAIPQHLRLDVVRLLDHREPRVRYLAARALRRDPENWEIEHNIVRKLEGTSISHPWTVAWALVDRGLDIISGEVEPVDWLIDHLEPLIRPGSESDQGSGKNTHTYADLFKSTSSYSEDDPVSIAAAHLRHLEMPWSRLPSQAPQEKRRSDKMINLLISILSIMGNFRQWEGGSLASLLRTASLTAEQLGSLLIIAAEGRLPSVGFALQGRQDEATQTALLNILTVRPTRLTRDHAEYDQARLAALTALSGWSMPLADLKREYINPKALADAPVSSNLPSPVLEACMSSMRASWAQEFTDAGWAHPRYRLACIVLANQENLPVQLVREFLWRRLSADVQPLSNSKFFRNDDIFKLVDELDAASFGYYLEFKMLCIARSTRTGEISAGPVWIDRDCICRFDESQKNIIKTPLHFSEREFRIKWLSAQKSSGIPQSAWIEAPPTAPGDS